MSTDFWRGYWFGLLMAVIGGFAMDASGVSDAMERLGRSHRAEVQNTKQ